MKRKIVEEGEELCNKKSKKSFSTLIQKEYDCKDCEKKIVEKSNKIFKVRN